MSVGVCLGDGGVSLVLCWGGVTKSVLGVCHYGCAGGVSLRCG